jgi:serine protease inhibitor
MKYTVFAKCLLVSALAVLSSGCLTQQTVTSNGEIISQDYVIKRPLKDAIESTD